MYSLESLSGIFLHILERMNVLYFASKKNLYIRSPVKENPKLPKYILPCVKIFLSYVLRSLYKSLGDVYMVQRN